MVNITFQQKYLKQTFNTIISAINNSSVLYHDTEKKGSIKMSEA
jgi:hypothetical protein